MKTKIFQFLKDNIWVFIPIFFTFIFCINFPFQSYVAGGDGLPLFYTSNFVYEQLYIWTNTISYGAVGGQAGYILLLPVVIFIDCLKYIFGDFGAQYIFYCLIFSLSPLGVYFMMRTLKFDKNIALQSGFFYGLSFLVWAGLTRNVQHITNLFLFTPFFVGLINLFLETKSKRYLFFILLLGIFNIYIIVNPWTFLVQILTILLFTFNIKKIKELFLSFFSLYILGLAGIVVLFTLFFNSSNLVSDEWNNVVLKLGAMSKEKVSSGIFNTIRGFNGDFFDFWGYIDYNISEKLYNPFPYATQYSSSFFQIISFIPLLFVIIAGIFLKNNKKFIKFLLLFIFSIFLIKGVGEPFGGAFEYCLQNIPLCGIFRSPHQKFSIIYILLLIFLLAIISKNISGNYKKIFSITLWGYILIMGSFLFVNPYISKLNILENVPTSYKESAEYINKNQDIKNILVLPFNESTWTNTEFGFEGYSLFSYLLPQKQIYNRNDTSFSSKANDIHKILGPNILQRNENILSLLNEYDIDTLIYDGYTDRYTRFAYRDEHKENLKWLDSLHGLEKIGQYGKIHIYHKKSIPLVLGKDIYYQKLNGGKYLVEIKNLTKENILLKQTFHKDWKVYLSYEYKVDYNGVLLKNNGIKELEDKNIFDIFDYEKIFKKDFFAENHKISYGYLNSWDIDSKTIEKYVLENFWKELKNEGYPKNLENGKKDYKYYIKNPDASIDVKLTLYFKPQSYFYIGLLASVIIFIILLSYMIFVFIREKRKK